jgi:hypothetical protein
MPYFELPYQDLSARLGVPDVSDGILMSALSLEEIDFLVVLSMRSI